MRSLLEATQLSRMYGDFQALKPTDLHLSAGDFVILTGKNGSGKSTLLLCLSGLLRPTGGVVKALGRDIYMDEPQARRALAYVPDVPVFYPELTAWEHLYFTALAHRAEVDFERRAEGLLNEYGLWNARSLYPTAYSRGMRLKLGLLLAFIRPFEVLLLDEPTSALDPESAEVLAGSLQRLRQEGKAVLLSTHAAAFSSLEQTQHWRMEDGRLIQG